MGRLLLWVVLGLLVGIVLFARFIPEAEIATLETEHVPLGSVLRQAGIDVETFLNLL